MVCIHTQDVLDIQKKVYAETRPPVIWTGKTCCGPVEIWVDR